MSAPVMKSRQTNAAALEQLRKQKEKRVEQEQTKDERHAKSREKMGWMVKKGAKRRNWKRRFFQLRLDEKELRYFPTPVVNVKPLGVINLSSAILVRKEVLAKAPGVPAFSITLPHRCYIFIAEDDVERKIWMRKLRIIGVVNGRKPQHYFGTKEWEDEARMELAQVQGAGAGAGGAGAGGGGGGSYLASSSASGSPSSPQVSKISEDSSVGGNSPSQQQSQVQSGSDPRPRQSSFVSLFRFGSKKSGIQVSKSSISGPGSHNPTAEDLIPLTSSGQVMPNLNNSLPTAASPSHSPCTSSTFDGTTSIPSHHILTPPPSAVRPSSTPTNIPPSPLPSTAPPLLGTSSLVPTSPIKGGSAIHVKPSTGLNLGMDSTATPAPVPPPRSAKDRSDNALPEADSSSSSTSSSTTTTPPTTTREQRAAVAAEAENGKAGRRKKAEKRIEEEEEEVEYVEYEYEYEYAEEEVYDEEIEEIVEWVEEDEEDLFSGMDKRMSRLHIAVNKKLDNFKDKVSQTDQPDVASKKAAAYEKQLKRMTMALENRMKRQTANLQNMSLLLKLLNNT